MLIKCTHHAHLTPHTHYTHMHNTPHPYPSTHTHCTPHPSTHTAHPGFIGYAPDIYGIVSDHAIGDAEDDQLYYTLIYLDKDKRVCVGGDVGVWVWVWVGVASTSTASFPGPRKAGGVALGGGLVQTQHG